MEELLKKLLDSNILTESTMATVRTQVEIMIKEAVEQKEIEVKALLTEKWIAERDLLTEALDVKLQDLLESEIKELKDDIKSFRDLEVEFAERLESEKSIVKETYEKDLNVIVEHMDQFIERRLAVELQEFATDLEQVKKNEFAMQIYETFAPMFKERFLSEDESFNKLKEVEQKLTESEAKLAQNELLIESTQRSSKMTELLSTLDEKHRNVMSSLLESVATAELEASYNKYVGVIIERATKAPAKDAPVVSLKENANVVLAGNTAPIVTAPPVQTQTLGQPDANHLRKLAGLEFTV